MLNNTIYYYIYGILYTGRTTKLYKRLLWIWLVLGVGVTLYAGLVRGSAVVAVSAGLGTAPGLAALLLDWVRARPSITKPSTIKPSTVKLPFWWLASLFCILFSASLVAYFMRPVPTERPLVYYALTALSAGVLVLTALSCHLTRPRSYLIVLGAILLGLSSEWSVTLMYPVPVGLDPWFHYWYTNKIIIDGGIQEIGARLPLFHLIVAGTMLATGLQYTLATMVSVSLIQVVVDAVLIYWIGKMVFGRQVGLVAAILLTVSSWHVWFGYWTIPNTLALPEVLAVLYLVIRYHQGRWLPAIPLLVTVCALSLFTHSMAMLWALLALATALLVCVVDNIKQHRTPIIPKKAVAGVAVFMALLSVLWLQAGYWSTIGIMVTGPPSSTPGEYVYATSPQEVRIEALPPPQSQQPPPQSSDSVSFPETNELTAYRETWVAGSLTETLFNVSGMFLFFSCSLLGVLLAIRKWHPTVWLLIGFGFAALVIGYAPVVLGLSALQHRWWYLAQSLLALPLAFVVCKAATSKVGAVAVSLGVSCLVFLMLVGRPVNMDNQSFSKNQLVRYALTQEEVSVLVRMHDKYPDAVIGLDGYYLTAARQLLGYSQRYADWGDRRLFLITDNLLSGDFRSVDADIVLLRHTVFTEPMGDGGGVIYKLQYDPREVIVKQEFDLVEDNGAVAIFISKGY